MPVEIAISAADATAVVKGLAAANVVPVRRWHVLPPPKLCG